MNATRHSFCVQDERSGENYSSASFVMGIVDFTSCLCADLSFFLKFLLSKSFVVAKIILS